MRPPVFRVNGESADASAGIVRWHPAKCVWHAVLATASLVCAPFTASFDSVLVFLISTYVTLLLGHSVGMHRKLIHRTFDCHKWLERSLVYLGVIVGMAGPFSIIKIHEIRDWAQREQTCHDFFSHRQSIWKYAFWQLTCRFEFEKPRSFLLNLMLHRPILSLARENMDATTGSTGSCTVYVRRVGLDSMGNFYENNG